MTIYNGFEILIVAAVIVYFAAQIRNRVAIMPSPSPLVASEQAYRAHVAEENDHRVAWDDVGATVEYVESPWISRRAPGTPEVYG